MPAAALPSPTPCDVAAHDDIQMAQDPEDDDFDNIDDYVVKGYGD
jgi:hypothetical protein